MPHAVDMHYRYRIRLDAREAPIPVVSTEYVRFESALSVLRRELKTRPGLLAQIERAYAAGALREKWQSVWQTPAVRKVNASLVRLFLAVVRERARRVVGLANTYVVRPPLAEFTEDAPPPHAEYATEMAKATVRDLGGSDA